MIVGITGGSGVGKTTALRVLEELGAVAIDCDYLYHQLLNSSEKMLDEIRDNFPGAFDDGRFDRKKLGKIVFNDPEALLRLNGITHKYVDIEVERILRQRPSGVHGAIDAIALFESGFSGKCDVIVGVIAPRELRIERIVAREGISGQYAAGRIDSQKPDEFFIENCDYILRNGGTDFEKFKEECEILFRKIILGGQ